MKSQYLICIFILSSLFSCASTPLKLDTDSNITTTEVKLKDGIFYYTGIIDKSANEKLISLYKKLVIKPEWINIKSNGGDIYTAMDFAEWIHKENLNVKVIEYCLSSCANYIFTAANKKIISNDAAVGFHGGASSTEYELDTSQLDLSLADFPEQQQKEERAAFQKIFKDYLVLANKREKMFFDTIGVSQSITTRGQTQFYYKLYGSDDSYQMWYYSISDFKKLGVDNIFVLEPPWKPRQLSKNSKMFRVDVHDIN